MKNNNFEALETIIEGGQIPQQTPRTILELALQAIVSKSLSKFAEVAKQFTASLIENCHIHLHPDYLMENFEQIKLVACKNNKAMKFKKQFRGFVVFGKAVSVYQRKKVQLENTEDMSQRDELVSLVQQGIIRLHEDGKYTLNKYEKDFTIDDILLLHEMPDSETDEVYLGNEVFSPFVPLERSVVMLVPSNINKPDCLDLIKSSILHVYLEQASLMNKIVSRELFYKNSILKGIFFIDEGEVEVSSKRIIARGWIINGKCKISGFGWKFKPIPFIRFLLKNPSVWKQFINDISLNKEYPFNIIHILSLSEQDDFTNSSEWRSLGKKKLGSKSHKLPRLTNINKSFDEFKYMEISKLRHYNKKINDISLYKEDLLARKLKGSDHKNFKRFQSYFPDEKMEKSLEKQVLLKSNSRRSDFTRRDASFVQSHQNILILSVLKRLESAADLELKKHSTRKSNDQINLSNEKQAAKSTPMQLYEQKKRKNRRRYA